MSKVKKYLIFIIIMLVIGSFVWTIRDFVVTNKKIDNDIYVDSIEDDDIRNGILSEKNRIKKEENTKIIIREGIAIIVCAVVAVAVNKVEFEKV